MATCAVSSANFTNGQELPVDLLSAVYRVNENGDKIVPWIAIVLRTMVLDEIVLDKDPFDIASFTY